MNNIEYPALLEGYLQSAAHGAKALKELLAIQVDKCPKQKIVLLGYSQGAQVVGVGIRSLLNRLSSGTTVVIQRLCKSRIDITNDVCSTISSESIASRRGSLSFVCV